MEVVLHHVFLISDAFLSAKRIVPLCKLIFAIR